MHILIECNLKIPALKYGGTERVVWWLGKALVELGHKVTYLAAPGSSCPFADVLIIDPEKDLPPIPDDVDVLHFAGGTPPTHYQKPYVTTIHGNVAPGHKFDRNTVFISKNQAERCGGHYFIHHGLDLDEYGDPCLNNTRHHLVFLAKAAWRTKNVTGAIRIARAAKVPIDIAGGTRLNFKMGFRWTLDRNAHFHGMVDQQQKMNLLRNTDGLLFPVLWHEPFGLAIIEAMYYGNPAFVTPWGSLSELVPNDVGHVSDSESDLANAIRNRGAFNRQHIHDYIREHFNSHVMAKNYLQAYEHVLNGNHLHAQTPTKPVLDPPEPKRFSMRP